jgi:hypothetical protein
MVTAPIKALATIIRQAGLDTFPKLQPGRPRREVGTGGSHSDAGIDRSKILSDKSGLEFCGLTPHHTEVRAKRKNPMSIRRSCRTCGDRYPGGGCKFGGTAVLHDTVEDTGTLPAELTQSLMQISPSLVAE